METDIVEKIFNYIVENNNETELHEKIGEAKSDYLDDDWEDEFDDIEEAYEEQGRGEAESQVVNQLIREAAKDLGFPEPETDPFCEIYDKVCEEFSIPNDH